MKKRVKDLGVIVGGLRGFALSEALKEGSAGEDSRLSEGAGVSVATLFSCEDSGVSVAMVNLKLMLSMGNGPLRMQRNYK